MRPRTGRSVRLIHAGWLAAGCGLAGLRCDRRPDGTVTLPADPATTTARRDESPVALDPVSPVEYPPALFQQRISGTVLLRLFADEHGRIVPESTRVQESS